MSLDTFIHLNIRSSYSLSEGALNIKQMVQLAKKNNMPALAITDSNNLFGALEFSELCCESGIQPLIGTSISLLLTEDNNKNIESLPKIILIAQNNEGYENLIKLSSDSYLKTGSIEESYLKLEQLFKYNDGILVLTGGPNGPLNQYILSGNLDGAKTLVENLNDAFSNRLYIEIQRHGLIQEKKVEPELLNIALQQNIPLVATNEAYFSNESMYEAHDALMCIASGNYLVDSDRRRVTKEHRFKSSQEMIKLFDDIPEAVENSLNIALRCNFIVKKRKPILPKFASKVYNDENEELRSQSLDGLKERFQLEVETRLDNATTYKEKYKIYEERLNYELDVIIKMGFSGYFLIVADFIKWAKKNNIPVGPGRGSGAGSLVAWSLTITDLDPIRFGLIFERFLNPERISMPDFDIDFCQFRRDQVIEYVQNKYGYDKVAQIITFGTLQARAALRDVGRVLQLPYNLVDRICKMVPNNPANPVKLKDAIKADSRFNELVDGEDGVQKLLDISIKLEGLYRHASTHAAGVVIADRPLNELIPLYRDPKSEMPVTQFSMKYAELSGLVKFDFLGLKTLTVIDKAKELLMDRGVNLDITKIPLDDSKTFEMLQNGDSVGVFQFESTGMKDLLKESKPSKIEDLIALVALYRPGPMENIPKYIACKNGKEKPEFLHETIEPIVSDTYGVIIYQEQVMKIAQVFADYTLGQADILRRAMGKKIKQEMNAQRDVFISGAIKKGVEKNRAEYVFDLVDKFAGYGFNKAHSAGYALVAYQTAWLKANYPVEFYAASMSLEINNTDKLNIFKKDMESKNILLLPPDINYSNSDFTVEKITEEKYGVRYALSALKNVGRHSIKQICLNRKEAGNFLTVIDFFSRINVENLNKRQLESLFKAGAFDSIEKNRSMLFASVEQLIKFSTTITEERTNNQANLFGEEINNDILSLNLSDQWSKMETLREEYSSIGFYFSAHPLDNYIDILEKLNIPTYLDAFENRNNLTSKSRFAGTIESIKERNSASGSKFAFVQLSDLSGSFEVVIFSEILEKYRNILKAGNNIIVVADSRVEEGQLRLTAQEINNLDEVATKSINGLEIFINKASEDIISIIKDISKYLDKCNSGKSSIYISFTLGKSNKEVQIEIPDQYLITPDMRDNLQQISECILLKNI